jgi:hypothetical protein
MQYSSVLVCDEYTSSTDNTSNIYRLQGTSTIEPTFFTMESPIYEPLITHSINCPHYIMSYSQEPGNCQDTDEVCMECLGYSCDVLDHIRRTIPPVVPWTIN